MTKETSSSLNSPAKFQVPRLVALIGFMGAGKTTVGQALATRLRWQFVDLDDLIQGRARRSIPTIFEESGEAGFRELERQILREIVISSSPEATVLSLGGGAFIDNTNQRLLRENEIVTVFLDASAEELFRRCAQPGVLRPLLRDVRHFRALFDERRPAYLKASHCVQTTGREIESIVDEIISRLALETSVGVSK
ncbi:MAG TPA: shikimate kinase [Terriglobales bacterium]|nr:shikimate kinase [Terriglobales bacterium]